MQRTSYPRDKIKILLLESISSAAVDELAASGYKNVEYVAGALTERELIEAIKGVHLFGLRSKAPLTNHVAMLRNDAITYYIEGYGNIGTQLSAMAEAIGMHVIYFDIATKLPLGNAKQVRDLKELLKQSDIITLHVPSHATTRNLI